jgi:hypothetical protein
MSAGGETRLRELLAAMMPALRDEEYVFCSLAHGVEPPRGAAPFGTVLEDEGLTIVIERSRARGLPSSGPFRAITLAVHSSLEGVGFIAAIAGALAERGIPANVLAGYHHDHLFVPAERAAEAMRVLHRLSKNADST